VSIENGFWFAYIAVEAVLIGLMLYRCVWRALPIFFSYCIWDLLSNIAAYLVNSYAESRYFRVLFAETIIDSIMLFCVLVEVAWSVLRPVRSSLSRRTLFFVGILILIAGAVIWPFAAIPGLAQTTTKAGLLFAQLQQTVSLLRILFFLILAGGSQLLSIGWRDRELQIATGLGFYSIMSVAVTLLQAHDASALQFRHLSQIAPAGFLCSIVYWLVSFSQKEAERREFTPQMQSFLLAVAGSARSTRVALTDSRSGDAGKRKDQ
jgi:hypothetical protein